MLEISEFVQVLSRLPGVGKKSAIRIAFYLLRNKEKAIEIAENIKSSVQNIISCSLCGNFTKVDPCPLCTGHDRNDSILCIVEDPKDLQAIEDSGFYRGRYHILMGSINPLEGIGPEKLRITELINRIKSGHYEEILIATNPTTDGEATFLYLTHILKEFNLRISRLATGIPMGGSLEYSDKLTLGKAIKSKLYIENNE